MFGLICAGGYLRESLANRIIQENLLAVIGIATSWIIVGDESDARTINIQARRHWRTASIQLSVVGDLKEAIDSQIVEEDLYVSVGIATGQVAAGHEPNMVPVRTDFA